MALTIAFDADDMDRLRQRLSDASAQVGSAVPSMPGAAAFGPAVLAAAASSFDAAVQRDAGELRDRWAALETGVRDTFEDLSDVETGSTAGMAQMRESLGMRGVLE